MPHVKMAKDRFGQEDPMERNQATVRPKNPNFPIAAYPVHEPKLQRMDGRSPVMNGSNVSRTSMEKEASFLSLRWWHYSPPSGIPRR
ncbi:hypothetical protein HPP92_022787 [Vanilla planifolia]|uniref:Uncharacterized protein n=1 Tax=Vanilla planifolia TaxID=51239 RepID=A0A835PY30_VANPL|nr:hypothetical protein HPP92_022787 [Vanilla planifolia]